MTLCLCVMMRSETWMWCDAFEIWCGRTQLLSVIVYEVSMACCYCHWDIFSVVKFYRFTLIFFSFFSRCMFVAQIDELYFTEQMLCIAEYIFAFWGFATGDLIRFMNHSFPLSLFLSQQNELTFWSISGLNSMLSFAIRISVELLIFCFYSKYLFDANILCKLYDKICDEFVKRIILSH